MAEIGGEIPVPVPQVRERKPDDVTDIFTTTPGLGLEKALIDFGLPYELDKVVVFSEYRHLAIETALDCLVLATDPKNSDKDLSKDKRLRHAFFAPTALLSLEAIHAKTSDDRMFLIQSIAHALRLNPSARPVYSYATESMVDRVMIEDEARAAELLGLMLKDSHLTDAWSPTIDWSSLQKFGFDSVDMPITGTHNYKGMEGEEDVDDADLAMRKFFAPETVEPEPEKTFLTSHNADITTMQRWAKWFAAYPVATQLQTDLLVIQDALELASNDPASYWAAYKSPGKKPTPNRANLNFID